MGYKEKRQPVERNVVKHGKHRGLMDMSFTPSKTGAPVGDDSIIEIVRLVSQEKPPNKKNRRFQSLG